MSETLKGCNESSHSRVTYVVDCDDTGLPLSEPSTVQPSDPERSFAINSIMQLTNAKS